MAHVSYFKTKTDGTILYFITFQAGGGGEAGLSVGPFVRGNLGQVHHTLRVTPLVIVPSHNLNHVVTHDHGQSGIDGGGGVHSPEIRRDQRYIGYAQYSLQGPISSLPEGVIDLLGDGLLRYLHHQVHNGDGRGGYTKGDPVQGPLEFGDDQGDGLGGPGGGGDDVEGGGPSPSEIPVGGIQQPLVAGVGVGGGHSTLDDVIFVVQYLYEGGQTVGGTGGVGDYFIFVLVVLVIHSHHKGRDSLVLSRGRDDDFLGTSLQVLAASLFGGKDPGTFDHDVNSQITPGQLGGVTAGYDGYLTSSDRHSVISSNFHFFLERSEKGVIL